MTSDPFNTIQYKEDTLILIDQRKLPLEEVFVECKTLEDGFNGIRDMVVRGAPCIGFTAIYTLALWIKNNPFDVDSFRKACDYLKTARPTAVNLAFEVERVFRLATEIHKTDSDKSKIYERIVLFGHKQLEKADSENRKMAEFARVELEKKYGVRKYNILTHCNTGSLACGSLGTALGVIQNLGEKNLVENVWVDETRPYLQGSRLTAYELTKYNIPHHIVVEGAASYLMGNNKVDAIFVGADRIVANGDTANKVGTSNLAIIAKYFDVPFYVVAPKSSFDPDTKDGTGIEIELRPEEEITQVKGVQISPLESKAYNPSFDIAEGKNITGIICEDGCLSAPYTNSIKELF